MIMNGLLITVLIKGHRTYKKSSFYIIVWQHITCDQLTQLIQFIVAVPITYAGAPLKEKSSTPMVYEQVALIQGYASTYLPVAMIVAYIAIYLYIKICTSFLSINKNNNETNNKKKDYKLLIQSFLICGFLEVQNIAWSLFPALGLDDQW
uniref:Uncharacterized protein n=1 Tax=Acrobeloides nanus TaxID=290746 RepID=A0A914D518_9BILA